MEYNVWNDEDWSSLIYTIQRGNCILILGPDASGEEVDGQFRPLTETLAQELFTQLKPELQQNVDVRNLTQVAQYYQMERSRVDLEMAIFSFYEKRWNLTSNLHRDLARLPFHFTIVSTPDRMLYEALEYENKEPFIEHYHFRGDNPEMAQMGSMEKPLIFSLYGTVDEPESLVLTENDLLDFLTAIITKNPPLSNYVQSELRDRSKSLLFLGVGLHKYQYLRLLLRILLRGEKESRSFAIERLPLNTSAELERAISYFRISNSKIHIVGGDLQSFVKELQTRYESVARQTEINNSLR